MRDQVKTLLLAGALSVLAGGAIAKQVEDLHCGQSKCVYDEEMGPSQTKTYLGYCDGYHNEATNSTMYCHPVKGMTCSFIGFTTDHWNCICTNWIATKEQHATIDMDCPGPNK